MTAYPPPIFSRVLYKIERNEKIEEDRFNEKKEEKNYLHRYVIHVNDMCVERETGERGMPKVIASSKQRTRAPVFYATRNYMSNRYTYIYI